MTETMTAPTGSELVIDFEPRGAVLQAFKSKQRELLLSGAAGTGKSVGALMKLHLACLNTSRVRGLIVRKTHASLTGSTLVTYQEKVAAEAIERGIVRWYGGSGSKPPAFLYENGSILVVGGLDKPTRMLSTEYDLIMIDEAIEVTETDVDTLITRLRNGRLSFQQLVMCTNPGAPTHHLKIRADEGRCRILYSTHEDNPRMHDGEDWTDYGRDYLTTLDSLKGARYQRMRWGKWVAAEGQIYEDWDPAVHVIDPFPIPDSWPRWWAVDFGYTNPFVLQCWTEDPDGRLYLYRELYRTKRTVDEHGLDILRLVADVSPDDPDPENPTRWIWREPKPRKIVCDHDAEGRVVLSKRVGVGTIAAKKGVTDGIQATQGRFKTAGDGKPRIFLFREARVYRDPELAAAKRPTSTEEEVASYVWAQPGASAQVQAPKEVPLKEDDHGMDAMRYMVAERQKGRPSVRSLG